MQIFEFIYTSDTYESAMATMSMHRTKKGAYKAMRNYLNKEYMEWYNWRIIYGKYKSICGVDKFGRHCAWAVATRELQE